MKTAENRLFALGPRMAEGKHLATENVRMLAHAYGLTDEEAARVLETYDFRNVARSILRPPRVDLLDRLQGNP